MMEAVHPPETLAYPKSYIPQQLKRSSIKNGAEIHTPLYRREDLSTKKKRKTLRLYHWTQHL
jgi:hypothetical protein